MAAGFTTSALLNAHALLTEKYQKPEFRHENYNLIRLLLERGRNMFVGTEIDRLKRSDNQTVDTFVLAKRAADLVTARAHNHTLNAYGDSQKVTLSFSIKGYLYGVSAKLAENNEFTMEQMLTADLEAQTIHNDNVIEALIDTYLSTYKTQSNDANGSFAEFGEWDSVNHQWIIPYAAKDYMFQYIQEIMAINNYDGPLDFMCDNVAWALGKQIREQGSGNATNLGWQMDGLTMVKSARLADTGVKAVVYAAPAGTVGMIDRIPRLNKAGASFKAYDYGSMADPLGTNLLYATHYYEIGASTASAGATQDVKMEYENSVDVALVKAPLSDGATYSTIFKFILGS
jgi:hypothetical protein